MLIPSYFRTRGFRAVLAVNAVLLAGIGSAYVVFQPSLFPAPEAKFGQGLLIPPALKKTPLPGSPGSINFRSQPVAPAPASGSRPPHPVRNSAEIEPNRGPPAAPGAEIVPEQTAAPMAAAPPQVAALPPDAAAWQKNAVRLADLPAGPRIAIVIDDAGVDRRRTKRMISLPAPLTISFLPYAKKLEEQAARAIGAGHEIMVHIAMEPDSRTVDPGPNVLLRDTEPDEILRRLTQGLSRFEGYVGINNHMGSRFTADPHAMDIVLAEIKKRGLLFLDSRTTNLSAAAAIAKRIGLPYAERNVFIDHDSDPAIINKQLVELENIARQLGQAVAIAHPRDTTLSSLSAWIPKAMEKGFVFVPISHIVERNLAK